MNKLFKTFRKHFGKSDAQSIINGLNVINYKEGGGEQTDEVKVKWCDVSVQSGSSLQVVVSYYDNKYPIGILKVQKPSNIYYFHATFSVDNSSGKIMYTASITDSSFRTIYEENKNLQALCIIYN